MLRAGYINSCFDLIFGSVAELKDALAVMIKGGQLNYFGKDGPELTFPYSMAGIRIINDPDHPLRRWFLEELEKPDKLQFHFATRNTVGLGVFADQDFQAPAPIEKNEPTVKQEK